MACSLVTFCYLTAMSVSKLNTFGYTLCKDFDAVLERESHLGERTYEFCFTLCTSTQGVRGGAVG